MRARDGARITRWSKCAAVVLACSACGGAPAAPRPAAAQAAPGGLAAVAPEGPLCGPWSVGEPWPTPLPPGGVETLQGEGTLQGAAAGTALLAACGDRIALVSCSVSFRAETSPFGDDPGTHVVDRPAVAAAELVARIRSRLAREGFEETWAGGGSVPQLRAIAAAPRGDRAHAAAAELRMGAIEASFLAAAEARGASVATHRGAIDRVVVVACASPRRCTVVAMESREACDAPGGIDGARFSDDDDGDDDGDDDAPDGGEDDGAAPPTGE